MIKYTTVLCSCLAIFIIGCTNHFEPEIEPHYPDEDWEIISASLDLPFNPHIYRGFNPRSYHLNHKATIGRVLFYDKSISADETISCASCHKQELAFADDVSFSEGVHGNLTSRNSFALGSFRSLSAEYYGEQVGRVPGLFWDNRAATVKAQMIETIANPNEMGLEMDQVVSAVQSKPYYQNLFAQVYETSRGYEISEDNILECLQEFMRTITSDKSRFDEALSKNPDFLSSNYKADYNDSEYRGKQLFNASCNHCHALEGSRRGTANNGLDKIYKDKGVGGRLEYVDSLQYAGLFKIPDLRNIALTAPYMHDGRFNTLKEVINHYSEGIADHENLHKFLIDRFDAPRNFNFSESQKQNLIDFLNTLTDHNLIAEEKWSDPFRK